MPARSIEARTFDLPRRVPNAEMFVGQRPPGRRVRQPATAGTPSMAIDGGAKGCSANAFCSAHTELTHHQSLDIVLLRDGNKFLNGAKSEVFAHLDREARVEILRHHQRVQLLVTGSGCVDAYDEYGAGDRGPVCCSAMHSQRGPA